MHFEHFREKKIRPEFINQVLAAMHVQPTGYWALRNLIAINPTIGVSDSWKRWSVIQERLVLNSDPNQEVSVSQKGSQKFFLFQDEHWSRGKNSCHTETMNPGPKILRLERGQPSILELASPFTQGVGGILYFEKLVDKDWSLIDILERELWLVYILWISKCCCFWMERLQKCTPLLPCVASRGQAGFQSLLFPLSTPLPRWMLLCGV